MLGDLNLLLALISPLLAVLAALRVSKQDAKAGAAQNAMMQVTLDSIKTSVEDMQVETRKFRDQLYGLATELAAVLARIDALERRVDWIRDQANNHVQKGNL